MDYEEWNDAVGGNYPLLQQLYDTGVAIGESANRALVRDFRIYMAVGGMPQAVQAYIEKKNFNEIDRIKRDIITLYKDDLMKIDESGRLSKMYESIPAQLVAKKNRFSFGYGLKKKTAKDNERLFDLINSRIVNCCYDTLDISPTLSSCIDFTKFKLYVADTGLFVTLLFNADSGTHEDIYKKLLSNKLDANLGYLYENAVSAMIAASNRNLYYFTFPREGSKKDYEIDFLLNKGGKVIPVEVKSNKTQNHKSIDSFGDKYSKSVFSKYLVSCKDRFKDGDLSNLPLYLFPVFLDKLSKE